MMQSKLDTSPVILLYNAKYQANGTYSAAYGLCVTRIYNYPAMNFKATIAYYGTDSGTMIVYKTGTTNILDYWVLKNGQSPRNCVNPTSDGMAFTLSMDKLNECYCYIVETGQILFAGKNTPYYGRRNISELN